MTVTAPAHAPVGSFASSASLANPWAVDVCAFVDALPHDATGEIVFSGDRGPDGAVFVEDGRICWAAARGLAPRLGTLLAASANIEPSAMGALYDECKRSGRPLGEYLVSTGLVGADDLRSALLKHSAESLHALCSIPTSAAWIARRNGGYSSRFTFPTTEILSRTLAESHPERAAHATAELGDAFVEPEWGAAFVRSSARAVPDPIALHGRFPDKVDSLLRLARWATSSLDTTKLLHGDDDALVSTTVGETALVAWRYEGMVIAGCTGAIGVARLLGRRGREAGG